MNQTERKPSEITHWTRRKFIKAAVLSGTLPLLSACDALVQRYGSMMNTETVVIDPPVTELTTQQSINPSVLVLASENDVGERLIITGTIYADDTGTPLPGAIVTVWHTDTNGEYGRFRGELQTDSQGRYELRTIRPAPYHVERTTRASHIHFEATALGMRARSGEFLFADDPYLATDPVVLEADPTLIAERTLALTLMQGENGPYYQGEFNLVLHSW